MPFENPVMTTKPAAKPLRNAPRHEAEAQTGGAGLAFVRFRRLICGLIVWVAIPTAAEASEKINLGLLIPTQGADAEMGEAVRQAAELALRDSGLGHNSDGWSFELKVAPTDLPWGAQTGEMVRLIYDEKVPVLIGALDGRSAHLAQQIVTRTKGEVLFLALSGEPTLTQIGIPWIFRLVPDDRAQARAIFRDVSGVRRLKQVAAVRIGEDPQDDSLTSYLRQFQPSLPTIELEERHGVPLEWMEKLPPEAEALVLMGSPAPVAELLQQFDLPRQVIYLSPLQRVSPLFLRLLGRTAERVLLPGVAFQAPGVEPPTQPLKTFSKRYRQAYAQLPPPLAAYAYDAIRLILEAINRSGSEAKTLRKTLLEIRYSGVTGLIQFDRNGNRQGEVVLMPASRNVSDQ